MLRGRLHSLVLPLAATLAVLPLLLHGPSCGHDFDFHLLNWFEAAAQFRHGNLHPLWAVSPAYNAGEPRFLFYPPISWTLGAVLGLMLPQSPGGWTWAPIAYTWIALTASGFAMHRLARAFTGPGASLLAATLYLANPYMLFTAYERTAYAELLAAAWLPWLVYGILRTRPTIAGIALPLALLWLTNAPAAVMGSYALALLGTIRLVQARSSAQGAGLSQQKLSQQKLSRQELARQGLSQQELAQPDPSHPSPHHDPGVSRIHLARSVLAGTALGLALAAFYIVPAATEQPFVQIAMAVIPGMRIVDNTLFHHTGTSEDALAHDAVLHTASVIAVVLLAATVLALLLSRRTWRSRPPIFITVAPIGPGPIPPAAVATDPIVPRPNAAVPDVTVPPAALQPATAPLGTVQSAIAPLAILTAVIALLLTPVSVPLWRVLPELAFLQFPWRLLAVLATAFGLAVALALDRITIKPLLCAAIALPLAATFALPAAQNFRQPCDAPDTVPARLALFQSSGGTEPTDEYTPAQADNDLLKPNSPPFWLSPDPDAPPPANAQSGPAPRDLDLTVPAAQHLILNLRAYPDWHIELNGHAAYPTDPRADGLITLPVPAGALHLHLTFNQSPREHAADALSLLALATLLLLAGPRSRRRTT